MKKVKPCKFCGGQIVYCQSRWKCKVLVDYGNSIEYLPLEGMPDSDKGKTFNADKKLFSVKKKNE